MKQLINWLLLLLVLYGQCFAGEIEVKVDQKSIKLPYWSAEHLDNGAAIIVRGGEPAQWSEPLTHLSELLAQEGWSTVLLNANPEYTVPWIKIVPEVISSLRQNKNKRIILIHYGEQLNMTLDYFSKPQGKTVNGIVFLSAYDTTESAVKPDSLRFPIFDIDGQFDYENVKSQKNDRENLFKSVHYSTLEVPGADHEYHYAQEWLVSFLSGWMLKIPEHTVSAPPIKTSYIEPVYSLASHWVAIN